MHHLSMGFSKTPQRAMALSLALLMGWASVAPAWAGGYLTGLAPITPALSWNTSPLIASPLPTFNNSLFATNNLIGSINNDLFRTPSTADPISTVTGNNYHDETDLTIRGRNELNYVFTRTYNSESRRIDRGMGAGWSHSYLMQLKSNDYGKLPSCKSDAAKCPENDNGKTSSITYTDERGGEQNFWVDETTGAVSSPTGVFATLGQNSRSKRWVLQFRNGTIYWFEAQTGVSLLTTPGAVARLVQIKNAWGEVLDLTYQAAPAWPGRVTAVKDNLGITGRTGLSFAYFDNGQLKSVSDWSGRTWNYNYLNGDLVSKTNPLLEQTTYVYQGTSHLLTSIAKPLRRNDKLVQTQFSYYQNGRAFRQLDSKGVGDTLDYDLYRRATRVTDAQGGIRSYVYDEDGSLVRLDEPDGGILRFDNQADNLRYQKIDALNRTTTYSYLLSRNFWKEKSDTGGNVTREQDPKGYTIDTSYGPLDQVVSTKDKRGSTITTTMITSATIPVQAGCDVVNRPKETRLYALSGQLQVLLSSQCWNTDGTAQSRKDYLDTTSLRFIETTYTYTDATHLNVDCITSVGKPSGISKKQCFTYDALGRVKTQTVKRRNTYQDPTLIDITTQYEYDALDRLVKTTDAIGNEFIQKYDANGMLWRSTHRYLKPDGSFIERNVLTRTFDENDRVSTETNALNETVSQTYDLLGNVLSRTDAEGHTTRYEYDAMNRRTAVIDATGYRSTLAYNQAGELLSVTNANGETVRYEYDALGRKTAVVDAMGYRSEFAYDANGNLLCMIDANAQAGLQSLNRYGCTEFRLYDELNRLTLAVDALDGDTRYTYDLLGNRLTVTDAENKTWRFTYDDLGRLASETSPGKDTISYQVDEAGNVFADKAGTNPANAHFFDKLNRLYYSYYPGNVFLKSYEYAPTGEVGKALAYVQIKGDWHYSQSTFDDLGRPMQVDDSRGRSLKYTFDKAGNIKTKTTYQGNATSYQYNAANRLVQLRNPDYLQADYQYDGAGRLLGRVSSTGARTAYEYNANGWLSRLAQYDAAGSLVSDARYTLDRVGNIVGVAADTSAPEVRYTLDALYRLKKVEIPTQPGLSELFDYDKVGNRKSYTRGSVVVNGNTRHYIYKPGTNLLQETRVGSVTGPIESSFSYDSQGRLNTQTGFGAKTLWWDNDSRLQRVEMASNFDTFGYDVQNRRIEREGNTMGNRSYFLEGEHLESEYSTATDLVAKYFRGGTIDELIASWELKDGKLKPFVYHQDQVGSVTAVTGVNRGLVVKNLYSAFGVNNGVSNNLAASYNPAPLRYTGRQDDGTGLYYYRARYYDPQLGRFISPDPIGLAGGINEYAYAGNNPINANDPSGMWSANFEGFRGVGGGLSVAYKDGLLEIIGKGGVGGGGGFSFDFNGEPSHHARRGDGLTTPIVRSSISASAGVQLGPLVFGPSAYWATGNAVYQKVGGDKLVISPAVSWDSPSSKITTNFGANMSAEIGFSHDFSNLLSPLSQSNASSNQKSTTNISQPEITYPGATPYSSIRKVYGKP